MDHGFERSLGDLIGGDSNDLDPQRPDGVVALGIPFGGAVVPMCRPIDLQSEEQGGAVEVEDEDQDRFLPAELEPQASPGAK